MLIPSACRPRCNQDLQLLSVLILFFAVGIEGTDQCAGYAEEGCSSAWPDPTEADAFLQTIPMRGGAEVSLGSLPGLDSNGNPTIPAQLFASKSGAAKIQGEGFSIQNSKRKVQEAKTVLQESDDDDDDEGYEDDDENYEDDEGEDENYTDNEESNEEEDEEDDRKREVNEEEDEENDRKREVKEEEDEEDDKEKGKRTADKAEAEENKEDEDLEDKLKKELAKEKELMTELEDVQNDFKRKLEEEKRKEENLEKELKEEKAREEDMAKALKEEKKKEEKMEKEIEKLKSLVKGEERRRHSKKKKKKHHKKDDVSIPDGEKHEEAHPHVVGQPIETSGKTTAFGVPSSEKLKNMAEEVIAAGHTREFRDKTDKLAEREAEDVLSHLQEGKTPTLAEFKETEHAVSEKHFAELLTAETANANEQMLTANDEAEVLDKESYEDLGPNGTDHAYEGDMIPADEEQLLLFQRISEARKSNRTDDEGSALAAGIRWSKGIVNYCYASDATADVKRLFKTSTHQYMKALPCLQFRDVGWKSGSSYDSPRAQLCRKSPAIFVTSHRYRGCYSYVGMVPQFKSQQLQLHPVGCMSIGTVVHEIGHALGMAHEQARPDRDKYVKIDQSNIKNGMMRNFVIVHRADYSLDYDYLSVMHYDAYAFAKNRGKPTITSDTATEMGNRAGLSTYDVKQLENMYKPLVPHCRGSALDGQGCIDKLINGKDICPHINKCTPEVVSKRVCCNCGGGFKVQCYKGQPCPFTEKLTPPAGANCLVSKTHLFPGYDCIFTNACDFPVQWKCPSYECKHQTGAGGYWMQSCNGKVQKEICKPGVCQVSRL